MRIPFRHRLSCRQAVNTVLIAFILGAVLSCVQIGYDLFKERRQVDSTVSQVIGMFRESATQAVFNVDRSMTNTVVNGLFEYRQIREARIIDEFDTLLAHKERPAVEGHLKWLADMVFDQEISYTIPLFYNDNDGKEPIGSLSISVDNYLIAKNFISRSGLILIGGFIRNIVLSCILMLFFFYTLTQPLLRMVKHVSSVDPYGSVGERIEVPQGHEEDEMGLLVRNINSLLEGFSENLTCRRAAEKELERHRDHLEQLVTERTSELQKSLDREHETNLRLNQTLEKIEAANKEIMAGIRYAELIQKSLLPNLNEVKTVLPDSFFIWMPKEIVGGDIFFADFFEDGFVMAVVDCTGHGVPGAFMTMLAYSALRRIVRDEGCHDPSRILKRLNFIAKTLIHQDPERVSDDGMDVAVCFVSGRLAVDNGQLAVDNGQLAVDNDQLAVDNDQLPVDSDQLAMASGQRSMGHSNEQQPAANERQTTDNLRLIFAGAKMPLIYVQDGQIELIKGDRQSIGYRISNLDFDFTNHTICIEKGTAFYISTDGFWDQMGKDERSHFGLRSFGKKRFKNLLAKISDLPFETQQEKFVGAFHAHKGDKERQDDVTVVGFGF